MFCVSDFNVGDFLKSVEGLRFFWAMTTSASMVGRIGWLLGLGS